MGCVYAYVIFITFLGPEYLGRRTDVAGDRDFEDVTTPREVAGTNGHEEHSTPPNFEKPSTEIA
jgi:hypothetical protein